MYIFPFVSLACATPLLPSRRRFLWATDSTAMLLRSTQVPRDPQQAAWYSLGFVWRRLLVFDQPSFSTPPKGNIAPEKWWLGDYFPFGKVTFQGRTVKLQVGINSFAAILWYLVSDRTWIVWVCYGNKTQPDHHNFFQAFHKTRVRLHLQVRTIGIGDIQSSTPRFIPFTIVHP